MAIYRISDQRSRGGRILVLEYLISRVGEYGYNEKVKFRRYVLEKGSVADDISALDGDYILRVFSKTIEDAVSRHNRRLHEDQKLDIEEVKEKMYLCVLGS